MRQARYFNQTKKKTDVTIDCGANVGVVTTNLANKSGTVYAFEPNPYAYQVLVEKFAEFRRALCFPLAVLDRETTVDLYFHQNSDADEVAWSNGSSLLSFKSNINKDKSTAVKTVDLAKFISLIGQKVKFLKIDVEGVEVEILNKLIDSGAIANVDNAYVETHEDKIPETKPGMQAVREKIQAQGIRNINLDWV